MVEELITDEMLAAVDWEQMERDAIALEGGSAGMAKGEEAMDVAQIPGSSKRKAAGVISGTPEDYILPIRGSNVPAFIVAYLNKPQGKEATQSGAAGSFINTTATLFDSQMA